MVVVGAVVVDGVVLAVGALVDGVVVDGADVVVAVDEVAVDVVAQATATIASATNVIAGRIDSSESAYILICARRAECVLFRSSNKPCARYTASKMTPTREPYCGRPNFPPRPARPTLCSFHSPRQDKRVKKLTVLLLTCSGALPAISYTVGMSEGGDAPDMRTYELMTIHRPELAEEDVRKETAGLEAFLSGAGATVSETDFWGKRRFAYEIDKVNEGYYTVMTFHGRAWPCG